MSDDNEAFVRELCWAMAGAASPACGLNLISLLTSGLMTWTPNHRAPLDHAAAKAAAADLVLEAVTGVMIRITELTLEKDASD